MQRQPILLLNEEIILQASDSPLSKELHGLTMISHKLVKRFQWRIKVLPNLQICLKQQKFFFIELVPEKLRMSPTLLEPSYLPT